jgi:hypothetical protein
VSEPPDPLVTELDALFQQLPAAHVEARNALADRLRKAGDRAGAERVKKLKRPSPAAWAINQLHFQAAHLLDAAKRATTALLSLHARDGVGPGELSSAVTAQRRALQAALDAAVRAGSQAGLAIGSVEQRKIETTLQAWLAGAGEEKPGRMTHELGASGFAAVTAVGLPSSRPPSAAKTSAQAQPEPGAGGAPTQGTLPLIAAEPNKPAPNPERLTRVRANVRKREQEADAARQLAEQIRSDVVAKENELERIRAQVREAERVLNALTSQLKQQEGALRTSRSHSAEADSAANDAERTLASARAELTRLLEMK